MSGSGLFDFLIGIILLLAAGFVFFLVIDRVATDATLNKIAKIAVGVVLLVAFLFALKAVFFGGAGPHLDPHGFLYFCIGIIVILVVLVIIDWVLGLIAGWMGASGEIINIIKYVIFAVALIAMLVLADRTLLGGSFTAPFRLGELGASDPSRSTALTQYLQRMLT